MSLFRYSSRKIVLTKIKAVENQVQNLQNQVRSDVLETIIAFVCV